MMLKYSEIFTNVKDTFKSDACECYFHKTLTEVAVDNLLLVPTCFKTKGKS